MNAHGFIAHQLTEDDDLNFPKKTLLQKASKTDGAKIATDPNLLKSIFIIDDTLANKISYYHLLFLLFSLPFDLFYSHIVLISFGVHILINARKENFRKLFKLQTIVLQSVFFITLIAISYSPDKNAGFTQLGRQSVIFLMPIFFSLSNIDLKKYRGNLLMGFALCQLLVIAYLYFDAFIIIRFYKYPYQTIFDPQFTNHNFSAPIAMHATFFSLQVGMALVYLLSVFFERKDRVNKLFYGVCSAVLSIGLLQLGAKSVCAVMLIVVCVTIVFFTKTNRVKYLFVLLFTGVLSVALLSRSQTFKQRFLVGLQQDLSTSTTPQLTDPRLARWQVTAELIKRSPIIGYGAGAETNLLREAYFNKKLYTSYLNKLNAHNEYLSMLLMAGVAGLLIYLATIAYGFTLAIRSQDLLFITFILLIAVVSLSENILDVDKGTMFYGLFFSIFAFTSKLFKNCKPH